MDKIPITVIITVRNEEANLPRCLALLHQFDQIIAVDSDSVDRTEQIIKESGAEYVNFQWDGRYPKKRTWALQNLDIRNEWVLFVDADEFLTPAFVEELRASIVDTDYAAFWLNYTIYFLGSRLRHGDKLRKISLLRKDRGAYRRTEEEGWAGGLDIEGHDQPLIDGRIGEIHAKIEHNDFKGLERYIERHKAYALWEAHRYMQVVGSGFDRLTRRQSVKYRLLQTGLTPVIFFIGSYFLKFGFLDGRSGFMYARYKAWYFNLVQRNIRVLKREGNLQIHD